MTAEKQPIGKEATNGSHSISAKRRDQKQEQKPLPLLVFLQDPVLARSNIVPSGKKEKAEFRTERH